MPKESDFFIQDKSLPELISEKKLYPHLRAMIRSKSDSESDLNERNEKLDIAEMKTNIAILYRLYEEKTLCSNFCGYVIVGSGYANFGNEISKLKAQSRICRMLADLDIAKIGRTPVLSDLYHQIRLEVDKSKKEKGYFLHKKRFWCLYFIFYQKYNLADDICK